ncbi:hypothetical protein MMC06_005004 [Schaereria dolodes]|nr:hypothetical protein [Schaereria dolodes]
MHSKRVLVIAGSDSSGGAGLEADQKVIAAHGCYAMTATTALTAQNTKGVVDIHYTPALFVKKQINACIEDIGVDVVKIGMLASAETIDVVAEAMETHERPTSVIDPVMVSTTGSQLLPPGAVRNLREHILPLTTVLTPNVPEAILLLRDTANPANSPQTLDDLVEIAKAIHKLGPRYVLIKGGHTPLTKDRKISKQNADRHTVANILYDGNRIELIEADYVESKNTHGTGCSLASAIASNIALGYNVTDAIKKACRYVEAGIRTAVDLGHGSGPINHFHSVYNLPFASGQFLDYLLSRSDVKDVWTKHTEHEFVQKLADGTLPVDKFKFYLIQDYLFLVQFARAKALGAYKRKSISDIASVSDSYGMRKVLHVEREMALHLKYCDTFGLSKKDVESHTASQACIAYTRYILDIGQSEDWFGLQIALAPCLIGYGAIAQRLYDDPRSLNGSENRYWHWVENYVAEDYVKTVTTGKDIIEKFATLQSPYRIEELVVIFIKSTLLETAFWDIGSGVS